MCVLLEIQNRLRWDGEVQSIRLGWAGLRAQSQRAGWGWRAVYKQYSRESVGVRGNFGR